MREIKEENNEKQIHAIMDEIDCSHDFQCYKKGIDNFLNFKRIIAKDIIECCLKNSSICPYSMPFGYSHFCNCPLLNYLHKKRS